MRPLYISHHHRPVTFWLGWWFFEAVGPSPGAADQLGLHKGFSLADELCPHRCEKELRLEEPHGKFLWSGMAHFAWAFSRFAEKSRPIWSGRMGASEGVVVRFDWLIFWMVRFASDSAFPLAHVCGESCPNKASVLLCVGESSACSV